MTNEEKTIYVTRTGLPLSFHFDWPFRKSTAGADFWYLHADIRLESGAGLHSLAAVNLSATVREIMPSLEAGDTQAPIINALRKEVDRRQLEFMKSGKLVPVHFSSRHYDFKRNKWVFGKASDEEVSLLIARKIYWQTKIVGGDICGAFSPPKYARAKQRFAAEMDHPKLPPRDLEAARQINLRAFAALWPELVG